MNMSKLIDTLLQLEEDIATVSNKYIYQPYTQETVYAFEQDCNKIIERTNLILGHYGIKAILNYQNVPSNPVITGGIRFFDLYTEHEIEDMTDYLEERFAQQVKGILS